MFPSWKQIREHKILSQMFFMLISCISQKRNLKDIAFDPHASFYSEAGLSVGFILKIRCTFLWQLSYHTSNIAMFAKRCVQLLVPFAFWVK